MPVINLRETPEMRNKLTEMKVLGHIRTQVMHHGRKDLDLVELQIQAAAELNLTIGEVVSAIVRLRQQNEITQT